MWYDEHLEHDPSFLFPIRLIQMGPPRVYDVDPRPPTRIRHHFEEDSWSHAEWMRLLAASYKEEPGSFGASYRIVTEYAHEAIITTWHSIVAYFDDGRQEYVRMGYYELRRGWWWTLEPTPPTDVPEELKQRLEAFDPNKAAAAEWRQRLPPHGLRNRCGR